MNNFAGTRAEREWLATMRRVADALERVADAAESESCPPTKGRQYAWIKGLRGSSIPDRSYVLRRIVDITGCSVTPSYIAKAKDEDGEIVADLIYWYGPADAFRREVAEEEFDLTVLSVGSSEWPPLPDGYERAW